jgi:hypothetical protein
MTDDELEQRLRAHYREIDPGVAPRGLGVRVEGALDRRRSRPVFIGRTRPVFAAALAAVVIVAVGLALGLRPGGFLASPGASPTPTVSPEPSASSPSASASPSPSPSPTPVLSPPSGSVPPTSTAAWTSLRLQAIAGGPVSARSVVAWSGGYLALGPTSDRAQLPAWISRDGQSWVTLPADTFGAASLALAAPCADGVLVAIESATGDRTLWHSTDGVTWTSSPAPQMRLARASDLAGGPRGAVAVLEGSPYRIAFSADGVAWQTVSLPGSSAFSVQGVAAFGTGFVAVGDGGTRTGSPVAWWSADGLHWTRAAVQAHPGDGFFDVHAASNGLVAFSSTGGTPGLASFWTSPNGQSWTVSTADPLGVLGEGFMAGVPGSANGLFSGDGTRLLGYGIRAANQPTEYWVSFDATHWTKLALAGDTAAAVGTQVTPFLLRDGVLFSGDQGAWFGTAVK